MNADNSQGFIKPTFIEEIQEKAVLSDVIGRYVKLEKTGSHKWKGCCPFHNEKTPSFHIDDDRAVYHCFGCGAKGNVLTFLRNHNGLNFKDAVKELANLLGMPVEYQEDGRSEKDKELAQARRLSLQIDQKILQEVAEFYQYQLQHNQGAVDYLVSRGMTEDMANLYFLGYAPANNAVLHYYNSLVAQGKSPVPDPLTHLLNVDVLRKSSQGEGYYDTYRERIVFPIFNLNGDIVGFGGRILNNSKSKAKYINPSNTSTLYDKSKELYGLYQVVQAHRINRAKIERIILVEGYLDVISLSQFGIFQGVAASGTAIAQGQLQQIFKYTTNLVCCFDGDSAGYKAAAQAARNVLGILSDEYTVQFAFLSDGEDPDSYLKKYGPQSYDQFLRHKSIGLIDYLIEHTLSSLEQKNTAPSEIERFALSQLGYYYAQISAVAYRNDLVNKVIRRFNLDHAALMAQFAQAKDLYEQEQEEDRLRFANQQRYRQEQTQVVTQVATAPTANKVNQEAKQEQEPAPRTPVVNTSNPYGYGYRRQEEQPQTKRKKRDPSQVSAAGKSMLAQATGQNLGREYGRRSKEPERQVNLQQIQTFTQASEQDPLKARVNAFASQIQQRSQAHAMRKAIEHSVRDSQNSEFRISYVHAFRELLASAYTPEERQANQESLTNQLWDKFKDQAIQNINYRLLLQRTALAKGRQIKHKLEFTQEAVEAEILRIAKEVHAQSVAYNIPLTKFIAQQGLPQVDSATPKELQPLEKEYLANQIEQSKQELKLRFDYKDIYYHGLVIQIEPLVYANPDALEPIKGFLQAARRYENRILTLISWYYQRPIVAISSMLSYITVFSLPCFTFFNHLHFALATVRDKLKDGLISEEQASQEVRQVVEANYNRYLERHFGEFAHNLVEFNPDDAPYIFNKGMQETYTNFVYSICRLGQVYLQTYAEQINNVNVEMTYLRSLEKLLQYDLQRLQQKENTISSEQKANLQRAQTFLNDYDRLQMQQHSFLISYISPANPQPMPGYDLMKLGKYDAPLWSSLHPETDLFSLTSMRVQASRVERLRENETVRVLKVKDSNAYQESLKAKRLSQGVSDAQALELHLSQDVDVPLEQLKQQFKQSTQVPELVAPQEGQTSQAELKQAFATLEEDEDFSLSHSPEAYTPQQSLTLEQDSSPQVADNTFVAAEQELASQVQEQEPTTQAQGQEPTNQAQEQGQEILVQAEPQVPEDLLAYDLNNLDPESYFVSEDQQDYIPYSDEEAQAYFDSMAWEQEQGNNFDPDAYK